MQTTTAMESFQLGDRYFYRYNAGAREIASNLCPLAVVINTYMAGQYGTHAENAKNLIDSVGGVEQFLKTRANAPADIAAAIAAVTGTAAGTWACAACTFANTAATARCAMCGAFRPAGAGMDTDTLARVLSAVPVEQWETPWTEWLDDGAAQRNRAKMIVAGTEGVDRGPLQAAMDQLGRGEASVALYINPSSEGNMGHFVTAVGVDGHFNLHIIDNRRDGDNNPYPTEVNAWRDAVNATTTQEGMQPVMAPFVDLSSV